MIMRCITITLAVGAWIGLGFLIGYQTAQTTPPQVWGLVLRYALAGFAITATLMASKYTARP